MIIQNKNFIMIVPDKFKNSFRTMVMDEGFMKFMSDEDKEKEMKRLREEFSEIYNFTRRELR